MPPHQDRLPDIVRDAQIETKFLSEDTTQHIRYRSGTSARKRRVCREEIWSRSRSLGRGAYGTVWLENCTEHGTTKMRAVKEIKKSVTGEELDYKRELEAVFKFSHPNYSHCFIAADGWYETSDSVYIIMEYIEHGDLSSHLSRPLPDVEAKQITRQLLEGLNFMHSNGFAHRDLKPGNIMVVNPAPGWFVKIADFGISKRRQDDVTNRFTLRMGTIGYAAPEIFGFPEPENDSEYIFAVDIWSLGALLCKILTLATPFEDLGVLYRYAAGIEDFPKDQLRAQSVSEDSCDFIAWLMAAKPTQRPSAPSAESHTWLEELGSNLDESDSSRKSGPEIRAISIDRELYMEIPAARTIQNHDDDDDDDDDNSTETIKHRYQRLTLTPHEASTMPPSSKKKKSSPAFLNVWAGSSDATIRDRRKAKEARTPKKRSKTKEREMVGLEGEWRTLEGDQVYEPAMSAIDLERRYSETIEVAEEYLKLSGAKLRYPLPHSEVRYPTPLKGGLIFSGPSLPIRR